MVFFRVDANPEIASGHVMRCLTLADEFKKVGDPCTFLVSDEHPIGLIRDRGYDSIVLGSDWRDLTGEVDTVRGILSKEPDPLLVIDTYSVSKRYVESVSGAARVCYVGNKIGNLGPLSLLVNYSADIDQSAYRAWYPRGTTRLLLGPSFAPLRPEFSAVDREFSDSVHRVLVTTGNTDAANMVSSILDALLGLPCCDSLQIDVLVGSMFEHTALLMERFGHVGHVVLHEGVQNAAHLMSACDLAISASGTTVYELCASSVPTIAFSMVEEQVSAGRALGALGAMRYCGESFSNRRACLDSIARNVAFLVGDRKVREQLALAGNALIDGMGAHRVVQEMRRVHALQNVESK